MGGKDASGESFSSIELRLAYHPPLPPAEVLAQVRAGPTTLAVLVV
jgi:hypothetical protein